MVNEGMAFALNAQKDIDAFIKINNLKEVTNPIYMRGNVPTPDGLLSYDIFGTTMQDRMHTVAYIDLKGWYLPGHLGLKLKSYDRRLDDILFSLTKYVLTKDGDLVVDDENGFTGPEFLYEIWDKVKIKDKSTILTKEIQIAFNKKREDIFIRQLILLPAGLRDMTNGTKVQSTKIINDTYSQIIGAVRNVNMYTDTFGVIKTATQSRIQSLMVEIYKMCITDKIKGSPSKYGFFKRSVTSINLVNTSRSVIAALDVNKEEWDDIQVKFKETGIPLAQVCSTFYPFVIHHLKNFFDNEFLRGGKYPYLDDKTDEVKYTTVEDSFDLEYLQKMVTRFIKSPSTRFDPIPIPGNDSGRKMYMYFTGRFQKENTTINRRATWTDVLYLAALKAVEDKYIDTTRFPLESINGQFPDKVSVLTTNRTHPVVIGNTVYKFYPYIEYYDSPDNAFIDTVQFSHMKLDAAGADFDGDMMSQKSRWSKQANADARAYLKTPGFYLTPGGDFMRVFSKELILTSYCFTQTDLVLRDGNVTPPKCNLFRENKMTA